MKLRIRKLLAAALVICLVAAMLPGAALAADSGPFKVGNESYDTLSAAVARASGVSSRTVILDSAATLSENTTIQSGVTLQMGSGASLAIESGVALTNAGTITNSGSISVAGTFTSSGTFTNSGDVTVSAGANCTIGGTFAHNGSIQVMKGNPDGGGTLTISNAFEGSGDIEVGSGAEATLGSQTIKGTLTVDGEVSASALTVDNTAIIGGTGTLDVSGTITVNGSVENEGTIDANVISINASGDLSHRASATNDLIISDNIDIKGGEMAVSGDYTQNTEIIVRANGLLTATGEYTMANSKSLTVERGGTLSVNDCKFTGTSSLDVNEGAAFEISSSSEVAIAAALEGTVSVENSELTSGGAEVIGSETVSGSVEVTKAEGGVLLTVPEQKSAAISGNDLRQNLVVNGKLTTSGFVNVESQLVVNGSLTVNDQLRFTNSGTLTGTGELLVYKQVYNESSSNDFGGVKVKLQTSGSGVYSNNTDVSSKIEGGISKGSGTGPNGSLYTYIVEYGTTAYGITWEVSGGTVSPRPESQNNGAAVEFTAKASTEGYVVDPDQTKYISGGREFDIAINGDRCSFQMPATDVTVRVGFKKAENSSTTTEGNITVTTNHNGNGSVNASISGRRVTVTARANTNYVIKSVSIANQAMSVSGTPQNGTWYYDVPGTGNATVSVYVTFEASARTVTVTNSSSRDGDVYLGTSGYTTTGQYKEGDRVYLRVVPDSSSFELRKLVIRNASNNTEIAYYPYSTYDDVYYFTMPDANVTVYGDFSDGLFEITTDIDGRGTLTIRGEDGETTDIAEEGEEVRIYASPSTGYRLGDIYVTYTDADKDIQTIYPEAEYNSRGVLQYYWFDMPEYDVEVYADFGEGDYVAYIDRSELKYGSVRVSPNVADEDDLVSVYITAETGYQLDKLVVEDEDGRSVSTNTIANGVRYTFNMPDSDVTVTATFKSKSYSSNFIDVARGSWYYDAVSYVASEGLMTGTGTNTFSPDGMTSRAQIVTILWRLSGEPSALTGAFTDVPAGQYYSTAVAWASREGIVTGVGNNRFEPNTNITREQLAVMLYRYAQDCGYSTTSRANITGYYDYARVGSYARDALSWAVGAGLITGTTTTTLSPQNTANRAQVATILMRFCENVVE